MKACVMCGAPLPNNQGSRTCSVCYGDPDHGRDGYYRRMLEVDAAYEEARQRERNPQWEDLGMEPRQCGQPWKARACGPTHALVAHERQAMARAKSKPEGEANKGGAQPNESTTGVPTGERE